MIIDHADGLVLPDEFAKNHGNELRRLRDLSVGLGYLNQHVVRVEKSIRDQVGPKYRCSSYGGLVPETVLGLVSCSFHWYAVSICNYVRLTGWVANEAGVATQLSTEYVQRVIPAVVRYRDKVAAHFARAGRNANDTEAERELSTLFDLVFEGDCFYAASLAIVRRNAGQVSNASGLPWSLTKTHAEMTARYWPVRSSGGQTGEGTVL